MDIVKAQRLSQNLAVVSDMVKYSDISGCLVESGVVSPEEDQCLWGKLTSEGNVMVMNELLTMVTLRRGGFDALIDALRKSDYVWLADQLDPNGTSSSSVLCPTTQLHGHGERPVQKRIMTALARRISRRNQQRESTLSSSSSSRRRSTQSNHSQEEDRNNLDTLFMSYRDECPIDIPINPSHYTSEPFLAASSSIPVPELTDNDGADAFKILTLNGSDTTSTITTTPSRQAVIYNLAPSHLETADRVEEYLTNLAKKANVPSPMIRDLKVLHPSSKISKKKSHKKSHHNKLKLQFTSETGRNAFVQRINSFIKTIQPNDDLYESLRQIKVTIPNKPLIRRRTLFGRGSAGGAAIDKPSSSSSSKNWYQKPFRFQRWKK